MILHALLLCAQAPPADSELGSTLERARAELARAAPAAAIECLLAAPGCAELPACVELLSEAATAAWQARELAGARRALEAVVLWRRASLPEENELLLRAEQNLASTLRALGEEAAARELLERVLLVRERVQPDDHPQLQSVRFNLANVLIELGEPERALELREKVVRVRERLLSPTHVDLARARIALASSYTQAGDAARARPPLEAALVVLRAARPADDPELLEAQRTEAELLRLEGALEPARRLLEELIGTLGRRAGDHEPQMLRTLRSLTETLGELGDLPAFCASQERLLAARLRAFPPEHTLVQTLRLNLAKSYKQLGRIEAARELEELALEVLSASVPAHDPRLVLGRLNLANTLLASGDALAARALLEDAIRARAAVAPEHDAPLGRARLTLAMVLWTEDDLAEAERVQRDVLERALRAPERDAELVRDARRDLGVTLNKAGRAAEARKLLELVLDELRELLPAEHPEIAQARLNLSTVLQTLGEEERALELLGTALEQREATLRPEDRSLRVALRNTILLHAKAGRLERIAPLLTRLADGLRARLESIALMPPREASEAAGELQEDLGVLLSFSSAPESPAELERLALELALECRQAGTRAAAPLATTARGEELAHEARALRARIQELALAAEQVEPLALTELVRRRDRLEAELVDAARAAGSLPRAATPEQLAAALPERAAFVLLHRYRRTSFEPSAAHGKVVSERLVAWVVRGDARFERVELGEVEPVARAVSAWREAIGRPVESDAPLLASRSGAERGRAADARADLERESLETRRLRELVGEPLLAAAGASERLLVIPDDALHLVPLEALFSERNAAGKALELSTLASAGQLLARGAPPAGEASLVCVGGLDYGERAEQTPAPARRGPSAESWNALAGARAETERVAALFRESHERGARVLAGDDATRTALLEAARGARFLHVATHGYFSGADLGESLASERGGLAPSLSFAHALRGLAPMALCGLVLSGANRAPEAGGGAAALLTAEELAGSDLSACELAVLSACDTNVGLVRAGRGIRSLQAALHAAGARHAITSLWKVDDEATRALFERFYTELWLEGVGVDEALRRAKEALRAGGRPTSDWAAWVLTGPPS